MSNRFKMLFLITALVLMATLVRTAARADFGEIEITEPIPEEQKVAIIVSPDAYRKALAQAAPHRAGQDFWVGINLIVGNPSGVRLEAFPFTGKDIKVGVEAIVGEQALSFAAGAGLRLQIRIASDSRNALYLSPGVDVYVSPPQAAYFGHYDTLYYVATDVDVSWVHEFSRHFGFELGLKAGGEIVLNAPAYEALNHTALLPELSIFTGVRF